MSTNSSAFCLLTGDQFRAAVCCWLAKALMYSFNSIHSNNINHNLLIHIMYTCVHSLATGTDSKSVAKCAAFPLPSAIAVLAGLDSYGHGCDGHVVRVRRAALQPGRGHEPPAAAARGLLGAGGGGGTTAARRRPRRQHRPTSVPGRPAPSRAEFNRSK